MAISIYLAIATSFAIPTVIEGNRNGIGWSFNRFAGLATCLAWPFVLIATAILASASASRSV
ncbi:hypothetical protein LAV84_29585 [Rhizobium sp. VS19-DR104.2]|uniref:hypothetical protein n=1 Tax=unclassified Rhizobium TaxID=2613769 RepID=UPI001C5B4FB8|nr:MULTISPECIES: hypothetical protein [unclassified Rhizobium]MBZ5763614.1 hypothetical protein [Rhizobium sp. VS19-DR96]MBZ5769543.1 hypothetical protein [Rhizobium sp. VS19-DR129.2]MBZ5777108.1 hypothetical protein [Rhizobium sp. VS19-DRK62.2]MBZ5788240.1 hypothetical protein [Rhizobium sp. VS19-DR121]MBZ5805672.1 hypothetical protein [Rhizobium sp. VS19-DR181]